MFSSGVVTHRRDDGGMCEVIGREESSSSRQVSGVCERCLGFKKHSKAQSASGSCCYEDRERITGSRRTLQFYDLILLWYRNKLRPEFDA